MALSQEIYDSTELAKVQVANSDLSDDYKASLLKLLNIAALATNGIKPEEKIQKMTEAIQMLAVSQIAFITHIDERIFEINRRQCADCKAMKVANEIEEAEKNKKIIEEYKKAHGIAGDEVPQGAAFQYGVVKSILMKPYVWMFGSVAVFSPFLSDIVKQILDFFSK